MPSDKWNELILWVAAEKVGLILQQCQVVSEILQQCLQSACLIYSFAQRTDIQLQLIYSFA